MKKEKDEELVSGTFSWRIDNFSRLNEKRHYSDVFVIGGYKWKILMFPKGNNVDYLSLYVSVPDSHTLPYGWTRYANFSLTVVNQLDSNKSVKKATGHQFNARESDFGFTSLIPLSELRDRENGFLVNDTCVVEVEVSVANGIKVLEDQETGELMDFKGLGRIEKTFLPFLEEVCSSHPSLIECQKKRSRSRMFIQCAFTALGRLLHFLKTTKVKDMTHDACQRLRQLLDELEAFQFDLAWLQPHVKKILIMKGKVGRVERLRGDVDVLEGEIKRRRAILAAVEVDLAVAKSDLAKEEEEGFDKMDMDSELGYPLA